MAITATSSRPGTPLSTKLVVGLGLFLAVTGAGMAVAEHVRSDPTPKASAVPAQASAWVVPGSEHLFQYVGVLVAVVCVAGLLVVARSATSRR
jgi:hypothetical protein